MNNSVPIIGVVAPCQVDQFWKSSAVDPLWFLIKFDMNIAISVKQIIGKF